MRNKRLTIIFSIITVIAILTLLNSVIFSARNVTAFCVNDEDIELEQAVLEAADIKPSSSIFFVSSSKVIESIQSQIVNVKVLEVVSAFPDRITIHFEKIMEYAAVKLTAGNYAIIDDSGRVLRIASEVDFDTLIELTLNTLPVNAVVGSQLLPQSNAMQAYVEFMTHLEWLSYLGLDRIELVGGVDFASLERIEIKTRTGTVIEILGWQDLLQKLQLALTVYIEDDPLHKYEGTIKVYYNNQTQQLEAAFSK